MAQVDDCVQVTLELPRSVITRASQLAQEHAVSVEQELQALVQSAVEGGSTRAEKFDLLSAMYRARLAQEGKLDQSPEQIMEDLRTVREQIANELYPD
jgi:hypothetical protein